MATYRAIHAACEAMAELFRQSWRPELFGDAQLRFAVYHTKDFASPMDAGASLFLYRVAVNGVQRLPPAKPAPGGHRRLPLLPLDLHVLLTPWAKEASLEQELLGWLMRTVEDTPILPAGILNSQAPNVFEMEETIEIVPGQLTNEEIFRIWDVLPHDFQLSVPYIVRLVRIASERELVEFGPVLTRTLTYGVVREP